MEYVSDLHLHSRYSRAVSQDMIFPTMSRVGKQKGLHILSASDFTHPLWFKEMSVQLEETASGLYQIKNNRSNLKNGDIEPYFLLSTEIASIYSQNGKLRRIHNLVFAPNLETAGKINQELIRRGCNLGADGRPIIGMPSKNLLELILSIDETCMLIPCHVWTPHFGIYGSKSGFDSLQEAFEDLAPQVFGIETGISSDPEMNWRMKELENRSILSFSDAHSPANMSREATAFELENPSYENIRKAIMRKGGSKNRISYTVEFYPEEGKYHFSGHRNCNISFSPEEIAEKGTKCPLCNREFTEGVAIRIEQLGGSTFVKDYEEKVSPSGIRWHTDRSKNHPPYVKLVRLEQIIAQAIGSTSVSVKTKTLYKGLLDSLGSELFILLKAPLGDIAKEGGEKVAEGIQKVRAGEITIEPGFDGEYGKVKIWSEEKKEDKKEEVKEQMGLF